MLAREDCLSSSLPDELMNLKCDPVLYLYSVGLEQKGRSGAAILVSFFCLCQQQLYNYARPVLGYWLKTSWQIIGNSPFLFPSHLHPITSSRCSSSFTFNASSSSGCATIVQTFAVTQLLPDGNNKRSFALPSLEFKFVPQVIKLVRILSLLFLRFIAHLNSSDIRQQISNQKTLKMYIVPERRAFRDKFCLCQLFCRLFLNSFIQSRVLKKS